MDLGEEDLTVGATTVLSRPMVKTVKKRRAASRDGWIVTTVAMDPEMHRQLSMAALKERAALTELVREAVAQWLQAHGRLSERAGCDPESAS